MGYVKNTWATGDTITAEKLNAMEDGIANAPDLPEPQIADEGKVVGVDSNGDFALIPQSGGGGAEPLDDDDLIDLLDSVSLFDAVYVTEDNTDYILSDESDNILMW